MISFLPQQGLRAVVSGVGCVQEGLQRELDDQGVRRPLIVCGENLSRSPVLREIREALASEPACFDGSRPHTPVETVDAGVAAAREHAADGLIAVGGSSAIDCAKGIAVLLGTGRQRMAELEPIDFSRLGQASSARAEGVPLLTITTTLSFAEFLPFWGVRHADLGRKLPYADHGCVVRTAFLDGDVAATTPDSLWLETGVKALDDALAGLFRSAGPEPFVDPLLGAAIAELVRALPASTGAEQSASRQRVLVACWMTKFALPRFRAAGIPAWLSTTARHALGGVLELPHGVGSCVSLPHALAYHADATRERQSDLARTLGWDHDLESDSPLLPGLTLLLDELGVPRRVAELGHDASSMQAVLDAMLAEAPQLGTREALERVCQAMY